MTFVPKAMAFDLDGTLAESKQRMSADTGELLADLLTHIPVAIMSGGSWIQFQHQFLTGFPPQAKLDRLYLFPTNAAMCFVHRSGSWLPQYDHSFSAQEKKKIVDAFDESFKEVAWQQPPKLWGLQIEDRDAEITFSALGQQAPLEEKEKFDPQGERRRPLAEALKRRLPGLSIGINAHTSIDITPHGINKAYGVQRFSELVSLSIPEMLYVGDALEDGGNDAVVVTTGIRTHQVFSPEETAALIRSLLPRFSV